MLFNSNIFIFVFLPLVLLAFGIVGTRKKSLQIPLILLASLVFYGYWNVAFLPLLIGSILFNYAIYRLARRFEGRSQLFLFMGVFVNLALISYFKYAQFLVESVLQLNLNDTNYPILPLAISFFTFQQISFLVDNKKRDLPLVSLLDYACYVSFFPQLIAGPIVRHSELIPQLKSAKIDPFLIKSGLLMFSIGLAKKVIIADNLSPFVGKVFDGTDVLTRAESLAGVLAWTFQLYFDFSGYSDMAIGIALMFGLMLPLNFNSPYKSTSIQEFWQRWHITLSHFLRDFSIFRLAATAKARFERTSI